MQSPRDENSAALSLVERLNHCDHNNVPFGLLGEAADLIRSLQAENQRHRKANLIRAVFDGWDEIDDRIAEAITRADFDAIPWMIAEAARERLAATEAALSDIRLLADDDRECRHQQIWQRVKDVRQVLDRLNEEAEHSRGR